MVLYGGGAFESPHELSTGLALFYRFVGLVDVFIKKTENGPYNDDLMRVPLPRTKVQQKAYACSSICQDINVRFSNVNYCLFNDVFMFEKKK